MNNPIMFNDPDGEFVLTAILIGAVIGGTSGYMIGHAKGATGWDMVGYIAGGAVLGGIAGLAGSAISTSISTSMLASGASAFEAGIVSGTISGTVTGTINGGGMAALSGGTLNDIIHQGAYGGAMGFASGLAGSATFYGGNRLLDRTGAFKSLLMPNSLSYMASSTAAQMAVNLVQGNNVLKDVDYGLNPGIILPFMVDISCFSKSFSLYMAKRNNTENLDYEITGNFMGALGRSTELQANGDLNYDNGIVFGKKPNVNSISILSYRPEFITNMWVINGPFIKNYQSIIQSLFIMLSLKNK